MRIKCPFVCADGEQCTSRLVRIEAYEAKIEWRQQADGSWDFDSAPRSHYHLFCSAQGNHAGSITSANQRMEFEFHELPQAIQSMLLNTRSR